MKNLVRIALIATLTIGAAASVQAQEFTKGVVNKIDTKTSKVTIKHDELKNLGMPAMTMVFTVEDPAIRTKLKEGANIEFVAERVNGKLTVTQVK
ncbi:copper-binding protein [Rhizobium miluonense]|uniref:Cu and Ag efflux protein CusF n=1 Tax=Rhizobium miluonense TaxID=411945 RepID=A0A1C3U985_9HYPH|nr:copper-binding protein [Rhizobium miluonense]SCB12046.1 Cu and Ag efflux protein CusF [Rhizobium miluonense]